MRRGHELGSRDPRWPHARYWAESVRRCERLVELDDQLPGFLEGRTTPASSAERIELGGFCLAKRWYGAAARFYAEAFAAEPKLGGDPRTSVRYHAARAAALAGCGKGKDAPPKETERARLRRQALDWLRADLAAWRKLQDKEPDKARPVIVRQMSHWLANADFAGLRGEALARLPEAERPGWQGLWGDVADTLARAEGKAAASKKSAAK